MALSGPAGGVSGVASVVAAQTKYKNLITVDMGVSFCHLANETGAWQANSDNVPGHFD